MFVIAIGIVYIPILLVFSSMARSFEKAFCVDPNCSTLSLRSDRLTRIVGSVISTACSILVASLFGKGGSQSMEAFISIQLPITVAAPFILGFLLLLVGAVCPPTIKAGLVKLVINRIAIGAFRGVWLVPVAFFAFGYLLSIFSIFVRG